MTLLGLKPCNKRRYIEVHYEEGQQEQMNTKGREICERTNNAMSFQGVKGQTDRQPDVNEE